MKQILKQILDEINEDGDFNLKDVDWKQLERAVIREGYNKNACYEDIKITVVDLFETVGYEEFGVEEIESTLN